MNQLLEFLPLILFFITYKLYDILAATASLVLATLIFYGVRFKVQGYLERNQVITVLGVIVFGGFTLLLRDETVLKWKAPIVNWIFALVFLLSHYLHKDNLSKQMMSHAIDLPDPVWTKVNFSWVGFFIISGLANLYVAFTYHTIWVDFKVFGSLAMTIVFLIFQAIYLSRYIKTSNPQ
ncbi:MAG: septation protein IspZ [Waddliaceae bacterium]|nr:septation protein IspZ [Waddliaceae bacterium]